MRLRRTVVRHWTCVASGVPFRASAERAPIRHRKMRWNRRSRTKLLWQLAWDSAKPRHHQEAKMSEGARRAEIRCPLPEEILHPRSFRRPQVQFRPRLLQVQGTPTGSLSYRTERAPSDAESVRIEATCPR